MSYLLPYVKYSYPQKLWNIGNHISFLDLFRNEVSCIVYHCKTCYFCFAMLYTSFVTMYSFRAEILSLGGGMVKKEMCHSTQKALEEKTPLIHPNQYSIPYVNFNQYHCGLFCWTQIWYISFRTPPPKGNMSKYSQLCNWLLLQNKVAL